MENDQWNTDSITDIHQLRPNGLISINLVTYIACRTAVTLGLSVVALVVGWVLYDVSGNTIYLGLAGLVIFAPTLALVLVVGIVADRFSRQKILVVACVVLTGCASALGYLAFSNALQPIPILAVLLVIGGARSFVNPTIKALVVNVVDRTNLPRAIALNASLTKIAVIRVRRRPPHR